MTSRASCALKFALAILAIAPVAAARAQSRLDPLSPYATVLPNGHLRLGAITLRPIEAGVADRDALSTSLRRVEPTHRSPTGFRQVYEIPGRPDTIARIDRGIVVLFPRSVYEPTREGEVAVIPPGAVFYLGAIPRDLAQATTPAPPPSPLRLSGRSSLYLPPLRASDAAPRMPAHPAAQRRRASALSPRPPHPLRSLGGARPSIWIDDDYRRARLEALLRRAAGR